MPHNCFFVQQSHGNLVQGAKESVSREPHQVNLPLNYSPCSKVNFARWSGSPFPLFLFTLLPDAYWPQKMSPFSFRAALTSEANIQFPHQSLVPKPLFFPHQLLTLLPCLSLIYSHWNTWPLHEMKNMFLFLVTAMQAPASQRSP